MTEPEWIIAIVVVAALWITALYFFLVDQPRARQMEDRHREAESIRNEVRRWREASERTYQRQGIRRGR